MEALFYFALWIGLIFLLMRLGCDRQSGAHDRQTPSLPGKAGPSRVRRLRPERAVDPVCGSTVWTDRAKPSVHDGQVYHFCSRDCREIFEAAPDLHSGGGPSDHPDMEHSHA